MGGVPDRPDMPLARAYTPTALPSVTARLLAFVAILLGGLCGGLIGYAVTDLSCDDGCTTASAGIGLLSAIGAAIGVAVVSVLTLRAMGEWNATPPERRGRRPPR
jgi:hypothetical protein